MESDQFPEYINQINEIHRCLNRPVLWLKEKKGKNHNCSFRFFSANETFFETFDTNCNKIKNLDLVEIASNFVAKENLIPYKTLMKEFLVSKEESFTYHNIHFCVHDFCSLIHHVKYHDLYLLIFDRTPHENSINYKRILNKIDHSVVLFHLELLNDDRSLQLMWLNHSAEKLFKLSSVEHTGEYIDDLGANFRKYDLPKIFANAVRFNSPTIIPSFTLSLNDEQDINLYFEITPTENQNVIVTFRDITELKSVEEKLETSEHNFKELFDRMHNAVAILEAKDNGADFVFTDINKSAEKLEKIKKESVLGRSIVQILPNTKKLGLLNAMKEVYASGLPKDLPIANYENSKITGYRENYIFKLSENKIVIIYNDFTQKKIEEQNKIELEKQLYLSSKLATLGELASSIGHEINNPLAIIQGHLEIIYRKLSETPEIYDSVKQNFENLHKGAKRIASVVRGLKNYSQGVNSKVDLFDLKSCIENTILFTQILYEKKGINFQIELPDTPLFVHGDIGEFQQVLVNLLTNAKDALKEKEAGTKFIHINLTQSKELATLLVRDSGSGIKDEVKDKIYDLYFTTKPPTEGTGLGLNIVKKIIEKFKGNISFESRINKGTTFKIELPLVTAPPEKLARLISIEDKELNFISESKKITGKCLYIDDDSDVRSFMSELLHELGLKVDIVSSGDLALKILKEKTFDIIICDYYMPEMNGDVLIQKMREEIDYKGRLFLITGATKDLNLNPNLKIDGLIEKPFTTDTLYKILSHNNKE